MELYNKLISEYNKALNSEYNNERMCHVTSDYEIIRFTPVVSCNCGKMVEVNLDISEYEFCICGESVFFEYSKPDHDKIIIETGIQNNNYGTWDKAYYFSGKTDEHYIILFFAIYHDTNKNSWGVANDWYTRRMIVYNNETDRNIEFEKLISMNNTFDMLYIC